MHIEIRPYGPDRFSLKAPYDRQLVPLLKKIPGYTWLPEEKLWIYPGTQQTLDGVLKLFVHDDRPQSHPPATSGIPPDDYTARFRRELLSRRYSRKTIKAYGNHVRRFIAHSGKAPESIDRDDIVSYTASLAESGMATATVNVALSALLTFFDMVLGKKFHATVKRPRKDARLPVVLGKAEIKALFQAVGNLKHKTMLMLIYSAGLRVGEAATLKTADIDIDRGHITIRQAKGRKDRTTLLSETFVSFLNRYIERYRPESWLFEGQTRSEHISIRTIQHVFSAACRMAGIAKKVSVHSLRHSFATHLLEQGTDIRFIQELLGHRSPVTTMVYTHVSSVNLKKIRNPMDEL